MSFIHTLKCNASIFKCLRFAECFQKALFLWWVSVDGRPNCRNKPPFSNFSDTGWTDCLNFSDSSALISSLFFLNFTSAVINIYHCHFFNNCLKKSLLLMFGTSFIRSLNSKLASLWNASEQGRALRNALSSSGESSAGGATGQILVSTWLDNKKHSLEVKTKIIYQQNFEVSYAQPFDIPL